MASRKAMRKLWKKTPSGSKLVLVRRKKEGKHRCALCHFILPTVQNSGKKSEKVPQRAFGGHLCFNCLKKVIKTATLVKEGEISIEDVSLKIIPYVNLLIKKI